jgi:hypothetical protein
MKILDIIFWSFFGFTVAFIAWQFLRLLFEALWDRPGGSRSRSSRPSGTGGVSGHDGEASRGVTDLATTSESQSWTSSESMTGGDSASSDTSGGGEYGGGGASGGW